MSAFAWGFLGSLVVLFLFVLPLLLALSLVFVTRRHDQPPVRASLVSAPSRWGSGPIPPEDRPEWGLL